MRRFYIPLAWILLTIGCKSESQEHKKAIEKSNESPAAYELDPMSDSEKSQYQMQLTSFFDSNLIRHGFNGAILVAKGGNVLYEAYIGYKNPKQQLDTIDKTTAFHLASTSKPFTAVTVLKLVQDSKIGLQDDLTKYFPAFPYPGITVENLLTHRSGLPNYLYVMEDKQKWNPQQMITNADVLKFLEEYKPATTSQPGTHFNYCNTNYVLLALIVEKVTGKRFPEYLKETIFDPLQMHNTFVYTPADSGKVIMSYKPSGTVWDNDIFENTYGDKNVYTTPEDMFKWDRALYNNNFIQQSLLDSAYQPHSHEKPSIHNYGLGWRMLNLPNGKNVIYHNGKWHGFTPAFGRLLDEKAVIIVLGNKINSNIYTSARKAYNFFGNYMQDTLSTAAEMETGTSDPEGGPAVVSAPKKVLKPVVKVSSKKAPAFTKKPAQKNTTVIKKTEKKVITKKQAAPVKKKAASIKRK